MANFLHKLFKPHCAHCIDERRCASCETLTMELERLRQENNKLLEYILQKPVESISVEQPNMQAILPRSIPWKVRKEMLENEDRQKAQLLNKQREGNSQQVNKLEQELKIS